MKLPVYFDYNATTPCDPAVIEAMLPYFTEVFGNAASRNHAFGWQAAEAVDMAREQVAALVGAAPQEIVFTSGATEAVNLAIKGTFEMYASKGNHIITVSTEHKAVLDTCRHLEKAGASVTYLPVDPGGMVDPEEVRKALTPSTVLIAVMYANNETGVIQPIEAISRIARERNVIFFTDATQAVAKTRVNVQDDGIDLMAFSAHKMYGPKGVGALYVRRRDPRVRLAAQLDGGGHERGMRSGTLNVAGIVGFGKACSLAASLLEAESERLAKLREQLERAFLHTGMAEINGNSEDRLPAVCNIRFKGIDAEGLLLQFNKDIAVSSGSACSSASIEPSHVLKAMGLSDEDAYASLRFSLGRFTTEEEVDYVSRRVIDAVNKIKNEFDMLTRSTI